MPGRVVAVSRNGRHEFSKQVVDQITLIAGIGVDGDAHAGKSVQHLSRIAVDPSQPNLRQVHLIQTELFDELRSKGHDVAPGDLGENIATRGIDLLALSRGALLAIGPDTILRATGLRNPCRQIERFQSGLLGEVVSKSTDGNVVRKAGIMAVVEAGGIIRSGDRINIEPPNGTHIPLMRV